MGGGTIGVFGGLGGTAFLVVGDIAMGLEGHEMVIRGLYDG